MYLVLDDDLVIISSLVVGLLILILIFFRIEKSKKHALESTWSKVPGALPIIGNYIDGGFDNLVDVLEDWATKYGSRGVYEFNTFGMKSIAICNEEKMALIERRRPFDVVRARSLVRAVDSVGGNGLFSAEGNFWRRDRKVIAPLLNKKNVSSYVPFIRIVGLRLLEKWETERANKKYITINNDMLSVSMDIISLVAFAKDYNILKNGDSSITKDVRHIQKTIMFRSMFPFPFWKIPIIGQYLDGAGFAANRLQRTMRGIVHDHELVLSQQSNTNAQQNQSKSFLGKFLMDRKEIKTSIDSDRLIGNLLTLFIAGSETTANTLCSCLYEISLDNTGLQDELASECLTMKGIEYEATLHEIFEGLPRMRSFMYEVLRIKGSSALLVLENKECIKMDEMVVPPKTLIYMLFRHVSKLQSSKDYGKKGIPRGPMDAPVSDFCPRRWLLSSNGERLKAQNPSFNSAFRPFGSGMRVCPGREFAEVEILTTLALVLRKYEISLRKGHQPLKLLTRFTQCPDIDIDLTLKLRQ